MTQPFALAQAAQFVPARSGKRFRLVSEPAGAEPRGTIIWAHAFGEEMNKTRRMCGRMARLLAQRGWRVLQQDLRGCGDSSGEFRDAAWDDWLDDLRSEIDAAAADRPVWLWGVRAGALLAAALSVRRPDTHLLLWQPVASGAQHLQQFLRLHVGARIVGAVKSAEVSPAQALRAGATVEVGGYELGAALAVGLEHATFDLPADFRGRVVWLEVSADAPAESSPAALRTIERLRGRGIAVDAEALTGPPFWQTQEIEDCDALLERSLALIEAAATPGRSPA